jgi:hypothetical protein
MRKGAQWEEMSWIWVLETDVDEPDSLAQGRNVNRLVRDVTSR